MNKPILENTPVVNGYLSTEIQTAQVIEINNYTEDIFRKKFVSKVYSTLWVQLLFTSVYIGLCNQIPQLQKFLLSPIGINLMYVSIFSILLSSCCLFGYYEKLKITPYNYLYVFFFTIMMSYSLGLVGLMYNAAQKQIKEANEYANQEYQLMTEGYVERVAQYFKKMWEKFTKWMKELFKKVREYITTSMKAFLDYMGFEPVIKHKNVIKW